jgi:hypothetical protein
LGFISLPNELCGKRSLQKTTILGATVLSEPSSRKINQRIWADGLQKHKAYRDIYNFPYSKDNTSEVIAMILTSCENLKIWPVVPNLILISQGVFTWLTLEKRRLPFKPHIVYKILHSASAL